MPEPGIRAEERVLAVLLRNPQIAPDISLRASHAWFESPLLGRAFQAAVEYACENSTAPTRDILLELMGRRDPGNKASHPGALDRAYAVPKVEDEALHAPYYCELLERDWKARTAKAVMSAAIDNLDRGDVDGAVEGLQRDLTIPLTKFTRSDVGADFAGFWSNYERMVKDPSLRKGILTGFQTIDEATSGHFNKELWVMVGGSGVGKSLWLGQLAINAALAGKRVMLVTIENSQDAYLRRIYSNICEIPYSGLKTASLTEHETERLMEAVASLPSTFCLDVVHMEPPCCARDILNIMRSSGKTYDYLVVDQITNMSPNHVRDFKVMDWRWYSQIALELRHIANIVYGGRGIPVHSAVHAAGGTVDKKELTVDDTALAKSIGYHADAMLFFTKKDGEYTIGKSKLRDGHFEPFTVFPVWSHWQLREDPPQDRYGSNIGGPASPAQAVGGADISFDPDVLEAELRAQRLAEDKLASLGESIPLGLTLEAPPIPAPKPDTTGGLSSEDL